MSTTILKLEGALDLDILFAGKIKEGDSVMGAGHFNLDSFAHVKLAANPRPFTSHYDGLTTTLHDFYSFGGWVAGEEGRVVHGGPMVPGPHAYLFEQGVMVTAHKQPDEIAYLIEEGTIVKLMGTFYAVHFPNRPGQRMKYPELVALATQTEHGVKVLEEAAGE